MQNTVEEQDSIRIIKKAIVEVLREERDLVRELLTEALEDAAMAKAIEEGNSSGGASREEVFEILDQGR